MLIPFKYTGDDIRFVATLKTNNLPEPLQTVTQIRCALIASDRTSVIVGPVLCNLADPLVNYALGKVPVYFPKAITDVEPGVFYVEFSVISGGEETTWADAKFELRKSVIV